MNTPLNALAKLSADWQNRARSLRAEASWKAPHSREIRDVMYAEARIYELCARDLGLMPDA